MLSAYKTGFAAGSQYPVLLMYEDRVQQANIVLQERMRAGIAHIYPESEFIAGFVAGCRSPLKIVDGLSLAACGRNK